MHETTGELQINALAAGTRGDKELRAGRISEVCHLVIPHSIGLTAHDDRGPLTGQILQPSGQSQYGLDWLCE